MTLLFLECAKLCEFGWINYATNESEIESIIQEILDYNFKHKRKIIYEGADMYEPLEHESWKQRCRKLLQTFFTSAGEFSGIITFPDTRFTVQGKPWESVINALIYWCSNSNSGNAKNDQGDATGLIIRNYDLQKHLNFCGVTDDEIKAILTFKSFGKKIKTQEYVQRFLAFNPSEKIILIIRMVRSKPRGELKGEVYHCIDDVTLLSFLLKDELKHSGVVVTGLVVYSGENIHCQNDCFDCSNFIVSSKIFNSGPDFENFWKKLMTQKLFQTFASRLEARVKSDKATLFQAVASKIIGYLAHLQFKISDKPVLPVTEKNATENIKQAELLLDKYQMEIAYSDEKHIFLTGNYGTGKTVVALKKLELLYDSLKKKEVIYYVNFAGRSQLHLEVMEKNKTKEKLKVLRGDSSLSNIINFKILPDEKKNNTKNINLIVDEYDSQYLTETESRNLYQIFQEEKQFKHSTVLMAIQPIKIDRTDYFTAFGKKREYSQEKHKLGQLKEIMRIFKLRHVMRTTVEINTLVELTQAYLNNKTNHYQSDPNNYTEKQEKSFPKEFISKLGGEAFWANKRIKNTLKQSNQSSNVSSNSPSIVISGFSSTSSMHAIPSHSQELIDFDELYKLSSSSSKKYKKNLQKVVTKYCYTCDSEIGHGINGPLPKVIELPKSSNDCEQIVLIAFLLLEIIDVTSKRIAILHFEKTDPLWLQLLFQFFPDVKITKNIREFSAKLGNMVLINNYNSVKGLEFPEVLLILDADEYHLKQFIPEAIARCMNNLVILIRPKPKINTTSDTVAALVRHLKKSNNLEISKSGKSILAIIKLKFCSDHIFKETENCKKRHCEKNISKHTAYNIHKRSDWYRDLAAKIQLSIVPNLHLQGKSVAEQTKAM